MVVPIEAYGVHILGRKVRRISIEEGVGTVVVLDQPKDRNDGIKQELIERKFIKIGSIN